MMKREKINKLINKIWRNVGSKDISLSIKYVKDAYSFCLKLGDETIEEKFDMNKGVELLYLVNKFFKYSIKPVDDMIVLNIFGKNVKYRDGDN